jgi:hypothetical protein
MKYIVQLYVGGKVFNEEVQATNPKDARETALARNPKAKVVGVNVKFCNIEYCYETLKPQTGTLTQFSV